MTERQSREFEPINGRNTQEQKEQNRPLPVCLLPFYPPPLPHPSLPFCSACCCCVGIRLSRHCRYLSELGSATVESNRMALAWHCHTQINRTTHQYHPEQAILSFVSIGHVVFSGLGDGRCG